jgi:hypothetical protein
MTIAEPVSDAAVFILATAIFAKGDPVVVEAYSSFETEPRHFTTVAEICTYVSQQRGNPHGSAHLAIHFRDTGGHLGTKRITLNPDKCDGFTYRFTHEGWGLVWVYLHLADSSTIGSFISANSQKRAEKWADTYPELDPPSTWIWSAVASHSRRLSRALKQSSNYAIKVTSE